MADGGDVKADGGDVKTVNIQELVDCFAQGESHIAQAIGLVGQTSPCLDDLAREANSQGMDVRAFQLGRFHAEIGDVAQKLSNAARQYMAIHEDLYRLAQQLEVPIPQPRTGGR